jgi:hypothetical protein
MLYIASLLASALVLQPQAAFRPASHVATRSPSFAMVAETVKEAPEVKAAKAIASKSGASITEAEVLAAQDLWASSIKGISRAYLDGEDYVQAAADAAGKLYGYGHGNVLFKPTKCAEYQFRPTGAEAMSYFVGCDVVDGGYKEDAGFAINAGKGWSDVVFFNHKVIAREARPVIKPDSRLLC